MELHAPLVDKLLTSCYHHFVGINIWYLWSERCEYVFEHTVESVKRVHFIKLMLHFSSSEVQARIMEGTPINTNY